MKEKEINKILVFNPFGIGDVLFTTPFLRNLKEQLPGCHITFVSTSRSLPMIKNNIFVDKTMVFDKNQWRKEPVFSRSGFLRKSAGLLWEIRKQDYDTVFDLSLNAQYGFMFRLAGIKRLIGYNFKNRGRFLTDKIDIPEAYRDKHIARYYLDLLGFLGLKGRDCKFDLFLPEQVLERAGNILAENGIDRGRKLIALCPGSGDSWGSTAYFKRWPQENFVELVLKIKERFSAEILILGSAGEKEVCDYVCASLKGQAVDLCSKVSLEEFAGIVSLSDILISNDGGPFHIAQALGKKAVVFFGPVDDKVYGVYPQSDNIKVLKQQIFCRPCYKRFRFSACPYDKKCLKNITLDDAMSAVSCLLADKDKKY